MSTYERLYTYKSYMIIQTWQTMKVLFGIALRQVGGFIESLPKLIDFNWTEVTVFRRQKKLTDKIPTEDKKPAAPVTW